MYVMCVRHHNLIACTWHLVKTHLISAASITASPRLLRDTEREPPRRVDVDPTQLHL